jgi:hypothetical protein
MDAACSCSDVKVASDVNGGSLRYLFRNSTDGLSAEAAAATVFREKCPHHTRPREHADSVCGAGILLNSVVANSDGGKHLILHVLCQFRHHISIATIDKDDPPGLLARLPSEDVSCSVRRCNFS